MHTSLNENSVHARGAGVLIRVPVWEKESRGMVLTRWSILPLAMLWRRETQVESYGIWWLAKHLWTIPMFLCTRGVGMRHSKEEVASCQKGTATVSQRQRMALCYPGKICLLRRVSCSSCSDPVLVAYKQKEFLSPSSVGRKAGTSGPARPGAGGSPPSRRGLLTSPYILTRQNEREGSLRVPFVRALTPFVKPPPA